MLESRHEEVAAYVDPAAKVVPGLVVASYLYRLATYRAGA